MTPKHTPGIPTWLLKRFGCGPNNNVVLGDLEEQYQLNGSALWYWRQALKAIPVSLFKELRDHAWIATASVMMGWFMWYLCVVLISSGLSASFFGASIGAKVELSHPIGSAWTILWAPVGIPAAFNQPFSYVYSVLLPLVAWAICGWMVRTVSNIYFEHVEDDSLRETRLAIGMHQTRRKGPVLLFAGATLLLNLLLIGPFISQLQHQFQGPPAAWLYSYVGYLAMNVTASILGILIGGGLLRDRSAITS